MMSPDDILTAEDIADIQQARAEFSRGEFVTHEDIDWE
jgi:predicted transcriptional regulator